MMDYFIYKKKSTTLMNQDFMNYLEKIVEPLLTIDPILTNLAESEAVGIQLLSSRAYISMPDWGTDSSHQKS